MFTQFSWYMSLPLWVKLNIHFFFPTACSFGSGNTSMAFQETDDIFKNNLLNNCWRCLSLSKIVSVDMSAINISCYDIKDVAVICFLLLFSEQDVKMKWQRDSTGSLSSLHSDVNLGECLGNANKKAFVSEQSRRGHLWGAGGCGMKPSSRCLPLWYEAV